MSHVVPLYIATSTKRITFHLITLFFIPSCLPHTHFTTLLNVVDPAPAKAILLFLCQQPRRTVFDWMRVGVLQLGLGSVERMCLGQFPFQVLLVDLFGVPVLVHVQVEGLPQREVLLIGDIWSREVVFIDWLSDTCWKVSLVQSIHDYKFKNLPRVYWNTFCTDKS